MAWEKVVANSAGKSEFYAGVAMSIDAAADPAIATPINRRRISKAAA